MYIPTKSKLTIKSIDLCDLPALVVSSQQCDLVGVASFQCQQQSEGFQAIVTSVYKVTLH